MPPAYIDDVGVTRDPGCLDQLQRNRRLGLKPTHTADPGSLIGGVERIHVADDGICGLHT